MLIVESRLSFTCVFDRTYDLHMITDIHNKDNAGSMHKVAIRLEESEVEDDLVQLLLLLSR